MPTPQQEQLASRLRRIQKSLGCEADGVLGPETLTALERALEIKMTARAFSLECAGQNLDMILRFEVGSRARYEKEFQRPVWPGGASGVTIGIGYDLGVTKKAQITADWQVYLFEPELAALLAVQGVTGAPARQLAQGVSHVVIPLKAAEEVFYTKTLPVFAERTRVAFPGVEKLPADAQGMMLSLVYNRGASLAGERRREMAEIARILRSSDPDLDDIALQFESMKRLWPDMKGLCDRRQREADIIRAADHKYAVEDLVRV
jgi:hypothetical protein